MRSLRPPPKVTPPKPPAHLFEPREDVAPIPLRLEKKLDEPKPYNFEDDVKFQMQQLENEMKLMLSKDKGDGLQPFASQLDNRGADPRNSYGSQHSAPQPFPERVNPSDWKAKGFPSEYAYMKATGQLDGKPNPQPQSRAQSNESLNGSRDTKPNFDAGYVQQPHKQSQGSVASFPERINPADWKAKGFPSEFAYMKATGQLDIPSSKPIPSMYNESVNPNAMPSYDPKGASSFNEPPMRVTDPTSYEKGIVSPARRKGGALQNLYVGEDELRKKFANQHSYSDQLQQQAAQQRQAREEELLDHRGVGGQRGAGVNDFDPRGANSGLRLPSERGQVAHGAPVRQQQPPPQQMPYAPSAAPRGGGGRNEPPTGYRGGPETERYDPAMLAYGMDRSRLAPAPAAVISPIDRMQPGGGRGPVREEVNTGLLLGLDKNSEKALKRAKQEEYKRQLDQMKPKQVDVPAPQPRAIENSSYLPTGARPVPERYDPRIPPAPQPAAVSSYRDTRPPESYYKDSRDAYGAPIAAQRSPDHLNFSSGRDGPPQARYPPAGYGSGGGPDPYGDYPAGPTGPSYARGVPNVMGAMGERGGPSPMRPMPSGRMEDPYYPQQAPYDNPTVRQERGGPAPAPSSSSFHASLGAPAESAEKRAKREQQEKYRRELEEQMEIKKAQKSQMKKEEQDIDQRFLKQVIAAESSNPQQRNKKGAQQGQQDWQAPPPPQQLQQQQPVSYPSAMGGRGAPERDHDAPRVAPAVRPSGSQYADDIAAEYELLKAKMAQLDQMGQQGGHGDGMVRGRSDLFEREEEHSYSGDTRDPRDGGRGEFNPQSMQSKYQDQDTYMDRGGDFGREPQAPPRPSQDRQMSIDTHAAGRDTHNATSPFKSPNEARTRFMKDIYGGDLITHSKADPQQGGDWRGAGKNDDRKRQIIAEQKAALDLQVQADRERKEQEKKAEEEKDRKKEEKDRYERERVAEIERKEKEKKDKFNESAARDLAELQAKKELEALARKGRPGAAPKTTTFSEPDRQPPQRVQQSDGAYKPNRAEPPSRRTESSDDRDQQQQYAPSPGRGRAEYDHIDSPMREIINQQRQAQLQMMMASHQQDNVQGGAEGRGAGGISLYESTPPDEMDRFLRERRAAERQQAPPPQGAGAGAGGYPVPRGGFEPSPYSSYNQPPGGPGQYPYPPPQQQYPPQYAPYQQQQQQPPPYYNSPPRQQYPPYASQQYPPQEGAFYPARGTFYADNDLSLVAESRLLPANPFSSSDMLASLVPIGATAHANAAAQKRNNNRADLEKSMASDSTMVFLGQRTPLLEPGAARPSSLRNPELAVAGMPSRNLHPSSRPNSSAATAKLSDVIQEANRVLEQEKRDMHSTGGATSGRNNVDATQANRLAPKKDYSAEPTFLGENDGISTYHRPDAHSSRRNDEGNLDDVPKNRIFLNQKQRYEDEESSVVEENEVAGFDENLARSIHLLDSAEKVPRLKDLKFGAEMSTQTSELNLAKELSPATPTPTSPVAASHSSRKKDDKSSKKQNKGQKTSPRSASRSPRTPAEVEAEATSTVDFSPRGSDSMDSPDKFMPSLKYDAPFSPVSVKEASTKQDPVTQSTTAEEATTQSARRNVIDANAHLVKPAGDHRSPRQRALENKQAREVALAAGVELPARKHVPIEEEIAELQSPQVPRLPRKNILNANEAILQAPADNRYRSPRQRALDRENSKKSDSSPRPAEVEENTPREHQQREEEEEDNSLYLPYVRNVDDSQLQTLESDNRGSSKKDEEVLLYADQEENRSQQFQEPEDEEEDNSLYLPYVRNVDDTQLQTLGSSSVDDTRFNEWPAEENYVAVDSTIDSAVVEAVDGEVTFPSYEEQDYVPPEEFAQDPDQQEIYVADQTELYESAEYDESVNNYEEQASDPMPLVDAEIERGYEQGYEQEYYEEEPEETHEHPPVAPEVAGTEPEQDYSYVVESGLQYADEEEEVAEPAEYVEGEDHTFTFESMLPEYYEDEEEENEELVVVPPPESQAPTEPEPEPRQEPEITVDSSVRSRSRLSSRGRPTEDDGLPADFLPETIAPLQGVISRPASGRPRTANKSISIPQESEEPTATPRPRSSRVRDPSPELVVVRESALSNPSRPPSGRPRTGRQLSSSHIPDVLDASLTVAPISSRPPTAGRPKTGSQESSSARVRDSLEQALSESAVSASAAASRPTTGRPRSGVPNESARSGVPADALEQALDADATTTSTLRHSVSRPGTGQLSSMSRPRTGAKSGGAQFNVDALDQALADSTPVSARNSRPNSRGV